MQAFDSSRREVLAKSGFALATTVSGLAGTAVAGDVGTADTKDHFIKFAIDSGEGKPNYTVSVPDPNPREVNIDGNDTVYNYDTYTYVDGKLDGSWSPYYDELEFDGSLSDSNFSWDADPEIQVTIDDTVVQDG